jgi:protein-L-isoaspartate(D-aspartate) O-methyltransferase
MMSPNHQGIGMTSQRTRERLINRLQEQGIQNLHVLDVMRNTPRHIFIEEALASRSYEDTALPIGYGQTISQPFIVARMTEALLAAGEPKKVLEVGTGSGYQTAILSQLIEQVYSVERIQPLLDQARRRFMDLRLRNVKLKYSDGGWGWEEYAPYDGILVTAAPVEIPQNLLEQLAIGGRLVIPAGPKGRQELLQITRTDTGYEREVISQVRFVPLINGLE